MQVSNTAWEAVTGADPDKLIVQNVGYTRIAFVMLASAPAADGEAGAITLDSDEHGAFLPGSPPLTLTGLDTDGYTLYVRSLGPKAGSLYVL